MKMVYIASPYTKGDVAVNVRQSFEAANRLVEMGFLPYPPLYSHFWHMISPHPYEYWLHLDFEWILRCDYLLRLPGKSAGADKEEWFALQHKIPVFYSLEELSVVLEHMGKAIREDEK